MSGTSLDGLDLTAVKFYHTAGKLSFEILKADTIAYTDALRSELEQVINWEKEAIKDLDRRFGLFIGKYVASFCQNVLGKVDFVASHGHTVFHQPDEGITLQIGDGQSISKACGLPVINNFRQLDVSLGGQGAPLVPVGDRDLFGEYDFCLNLGGIANLSFEHNGARIAYDICPFNMALNELALLSGQPFDEGGRLASEGRVDLTLLEQLNAIPYLEEAGPKSLGFEDYRKYWQPILHSSKISTTDKLRSFVEHAATRIANIFDQGSNEASVFITGGGAFNTYFLSRLAQLSSARLVMPEAQIVNYKEALVFAYLGLLRHQGLPNCLASVTGARADSSGGDAYGFEKV